MQEFKKEIRSIISQEYPVRGVRAPRGGKFYREKYPSFRSGYLEALEEDPGFSPDSYHEGLYLKRLVLLRDGLCLFTAEEAEKMRMPILDLWTQLGYLSKEPPHGLWINACLGEMPDVGRYCEYLLVRKAVRLVLPCAKKCLHAETSLDTAEYVISLAKWQITIRQLLDCAAKRAVSEYIQKYPEGYGRFNVGPFPKESLSIETYLSLRKQEKIMPTSNLLDIIKDIPDLKEQEKEVKWLCGVSAARHTIFSWAGLTDNTRILEICLEVSPNMMGEDTIIERCYLWLEKKRFNSLEFILNRLPRGGVKQILHVMCLAGELTFLSGRGRKFLETCDQIGLNVMYSHAIAYRQYPVADFLKNNFSATNRRIEVPVSGSMCKESTLYRLGIPFLNRDTATANTVEYMFSLAKESDRDDPVLRYNVFSLVLSSGYSLSVRKALDLLKPDRAVLNHMIVEARRVRRADVEILLKEEMGKVASALNSEHPLGACVR